MKVAAITVATITSAALTAALLIGGAVTGADFGAYPVVSMVVFVVTALLS